MNNTPQSNINNRSWYFVDWNIRGANSHIHWDAIKAKADESNCHVLCLQETKREHFDHSYIKNFCPRRLNQFAYSPSIGNSGGIITVWNGNIFDGVVISCHKFQLTVQLTCKLSAWVLYVTNVYAPTANAEREEFLTWFNEIDTSLMEFWMIMGDFNLMRSPENRNRPGVTLTICLDLTALFSILTYRKSHSKVELSLGAICKTLPCWKN